MGPAGLLIIWEINFLTTACVQTVVHLEWIRKENVVYQLEVMFQ